MGVCSSKKSKNDLNINAKLQKPWPDSPSRRHTGDNFKYGTDLYINLKNGSISDFYSVTETLGTGAFGVVKLAINKNTGVKRALKTLEKKKIPHEEKQNMFCEVNILRKLDHPNIVKLYELYEDKKNYYLLMEFLQGGELIKKLLGGNSFSEQEAARYMGQLLSALKYCHKQKIVHRDLKLENLVLDCKSENGIVKVIDFGTSKKLIDKYLTNNFGTFHYTAPEVFKGQYDEKCDIWSCGVILHAFLVGYFPFNGVDPKSTQRLILQGKLKFDQKDWENINPQAKELVKKMLTYNPEQRITAEEAHKDPWIVGDGVKYSQFSEQVILKLRKSQVNHILQDLILQYMAMHVMNLEEKNILLHEFQSLDQDGDGQLSRDDLILGLKHFKKVDDVEDIEIIVDSIIQKCDTNKTGSIGFHNFITIMSQEETLRKRNKLEEAFHIFDQDNDGFINKQDFEQVVGGILIDDNHWNEFVLNIETKSNKISKEQFFQIMHLIE